MLPGTPIQTALDIAMFVLLALASYALVFQPETQYRWLILMVMFGYLYYFVRYRLGAYAVEPRKYKIHDMPRYVSKKQDGEDNLVNNSIFLQEMERRSQERSQR